MTSVGAMQDRRNRVKTLTTQGLSAQDIAATLGITQRSVTRHRSAPDEYRTGRNDQQPSSGVRCAVCDRITTANGRLYQVHRSQPGGSVLCSNSQLPLPVMEGSPRTHSHRVNQVSVLANVVQDEDPSSAYDYLTGLSAREVQAIAMYALMAIDLDRPKRELWPDWTRRVEVSA